MLSASLVAVGIFSVSHGLSLTVSKREGCLAVPGTADVSSLPSVLCGGAMNSDDAGLLQGVVAAVPGELSGPALAATARLWGRKTIGRCRSARARAKQVRASTSGLDEGSALGGLGCAGLW